MKRNIDQQGNIEIYVNGEFEGLDFKIPVITGGFGENQKVILAKTVAEIHGVELFNLNKVINNNITRFNENDLIDLKNCCSKEQLLEMGFTPAQYGNAKNIFLLSQMAYIKLVSMMDNSNDKKWEVMDKLVYEYFALKDQALQLSEKQQLILDIFYGKNEDANSTKKLFF